MLEISFSTISGSDFIYFSIFIFYNLKWALNIHRRYYFFGKPTTVFSRLCGITNVYGKYFRFRYIWFKLKNSWNTCSVNLIYFSIFFVYNLRRALSLHRHYHFFGKPIQHSVRHIWLNLQRLQIHPLLNILDLH